MEHLLTFLKFIFGLSQRVTSGTASINMLPALVDDPVEPLRTELLRTARSQRHLAIRKGKWVYVAAKPKVDFDATGNPHSGTDYGFLAPMMFDLLFLAIKSDSSRVFTAGFGMHNRTIELGGVTGGYHGLSHHGNVPAKLRQLKIVDKFYFEQLARFIERFKDTPLGNRGDGTLLDKTMVLFGTGLGDAARHSNRDLPTVIAGGGFKHRGHVDAKQARGERTPLNNLYAVVHGYSGHNITSATTKIDFVSVSSAYRWNSWRYTKNTGKIRIG